MKSYVVILLAGVGSLWGCRQPSSQEPAFSIGEKEATILRFDASKHFCGYSWIIQVGKDEYRAYGLEEGVPKAFQNENVAVWITYTNDSHREGCNAIVLTSIRAR